MADLKITEDGDLVVGPNGDFLLVTGDEEILQKVLFRLKTQKGDYLLNPDLGANLEFFIGKPNTEEIRIAIEQEVENELTRDFLLFSPEIKAVPIEIEGDEDGRQSGVLILIEFASIESPNKIIQVTSSLDLRTGKVFSRTTFRTV